MATSMLELGVGTGKWDAGLKKAKQSLDNFTQANGGLQQALEKESQKMQKFVQMMGQMDSTAKTAKGQMNDYKATIEQLTMQYNRMSEAQKKTIGQDYLNSIDQIKEKFRQAKAEMEGINKSLGDMKMPDMKGGGFLSGIGDKMSGALQVFGGNMLTKAAGAVANLGSEMYGMVQQGVELAKQGEGIRIAFERLGRGDILDGLRQATHGTVTDIELMKAAVKFNDFKLPLDELGTMLAFAQQKAKDTGQSVDYMVDSIVTGLGRKSLMILDNLGLSASEVKERMAETGDMTKAVGAIIREQMAKAGDYVETAADRAAQANVSLQNKMEELGRKFAPVEEASNQLWTSMKIGILDVVGGPLARLLNGLTEAGRLKNQLNNMNGEPGSGNTKVDQQLKKLNVIKKGGGSDYYFQSTLSGMMEDYNRQIMALDAQIKNGGKPVGGGSGSSQDVRYLQQKMDALKIMRDQLAAGAKEINKPLKIKSNIPDVTGGGRSGGGGGKTIVEEKDDFKEVEEIVGLLNLQKQKLDDLQAMKPFAETEDEIVRLNKEIEKANTEYQRLLNLGKEKPIEIATGTSITNDAGMSAYIASIKQQLETADYGTSLYNGLSAQLADMTTLQNLVGESLKAGLGTAMFDAADATGKDFWTRAMEGGVDNIDWQNIADKINEARKAAGLDAIVINFKTGDVKSQAKEMSKDWKDAASAVQQVGSAMASIEDPAAKVAGTVMQAIASVALGYASALKYAGEVGGPWGWIAFAATGLATMLSTISAIHSATGYANGGMVKGSSYSGDNIPALVDGSELVGLNAGEIVLNAAQSSNVAQGLQSSSRDVHVTGQISGENIILAANRTFKRKGQGEIVTW